MVLRMDLPNIWSLGSIVELVGFWTLVGYESSRDNIILLPNPMIWRCGNLPFSQQISFVVPDLVWVGGEGT
jgi:hypothetical protein